jgi:hypothetical protein
LQGNSTPPVAVVAQSMVVYSRAVLPTATLSNVTPAVLCHAVLCCAVAQGDHNHPMPGGQYSHAVLHKMCLSIIACCAMLRCAVAG